MNEGFQFYDMFATKGLEYIAVIFFLGLFILYWRWLNRSANADQNIESGNIGWFNIAQNRFYHPGHSWVELQDDGTVTIGLDEFANKMLGRFEGANVSAASHKIKQGKRALDIKISGKRIPVLAPVDGDIIELNDSPGQKSGANAGWLARIQPTDIGSNLHNLLNGSLARLWMHSEIGKLNEMMGSRLGIVLQDGGIPINGFAKELSNEEWDKIARFFLKTENIEQE